MKQFLNNFTNALLSWFIGFLKSIRATVHVLSYAFTATLIYSVFTNVSILEKLWSIFVGILVLWCAVSYHVDEGKPFVDKLIKKQNKEAQEDATLISTEE